MALNTQKEKFKFLLSWTLFNALALIIGYMLSLVAALFIAESIFGLSLSEWGTPFEQMLIQIIAGVIFGFSLGFTQWKLLRRKFSIASKWIYTVVIGIILVELILGIVFWQMNMNRSEYSFVENNPIPHALIAASYGLAIGILQMLLLRKHFFGSAFWVVGCIFAWGVSILVTAIDTVTDTQLLLLFVLGTLLFGLITGATLLWVLLPKESKS